MEQKTASNIKLAVIYYIVASIVGFIGALLSSALVMNEPIVSMGADVSLWVSYVIKFIFLWLGVFYGSRYLYKRYMGFDAQVVVKKSTVIFIILTLASVLLLFLSPEEGEVFSVLDTVVNLIAVVAFYLLSQKYLVRKA